MAKKTDFSLEGRLVLHGWINDLLGYGSTREVLGDLDGVDEGFDGEGRSGVLRHLDSRSDKLKLPLADLERYDENVRRHLERINHHRPEPVTLRYFQHLAALYTEIFLDRWSRDRDALTADLDAFAAGREEPTSFAEGDLNKLAFWMATGSGKTLLMHLNYWQFLYYAGKPPDNVLLITPNAGLTEQHLDEMRKSGIPCERFSAQESGLGLPEADVGALTRIVDPRDLYREQLRVAENVLAFLASVSLALLKEEDRGAIDPREYWSKGASPGDWKKITQICSKIFAGYGDVPLATAIHKLKIGTEQKGFGRDVKGLIKAKNDYKHDRGSTGLGAIMDASDEAQGMLRRCMEALTFLADHPLFEGKGPGNRDDLFLDPGNGDRVSLNPFVTRTACPDCVADETYLIDAWDTKKGTARLKSFERGHTMLNEEVAEALQEWSDNVRSDVS
ncbi:MAG: DEAD/DEAH box helicase family protein [Rubrobacter sp.]